MSIITDKGKDKRLYKPLLDKIISKSFKKLKKEKIYLKLRYLKKFSMSANKTIFRRLIIMINPKKYKGASKGELIGGLSHELIHISDFIKWSSWKKELHDLKYIYLKKYRRRFERETDKRVIRRGYAKQLYQNRLGRKRRMTKEKYEKMIYFYLSPDEIKSYAKSIGKW